MITFEWDSNKNLSNQRKHGISFEEACTVFLDENAIIYSDSEHSSSEERFLIVGLSNRLNLLVVVHCYRNSADVIRIISARRATLSESKQFVNREGKW